MKRKRQVAVAQFIVPILFCLIGASGLAQRINAITFDKLPQDYQLYPRNAQSEAQVPVAGRVSEAGWQYVSVKVFRNKQVVGYKRAAINYADGIGRFIVDPITIRAEKAEYDLAISLVKGADSVHVVDRTNIVAGDVYVFTGQSNASAFFRETRTNEFCRTFGKTSGTYGVDPGNPADTAWALSNQTLLTQDVGTFGFEFQQLILEKYGVPTCLINGAFHWAMMAHYATRTSGNPADLANGYGRLLYRLQKGGLDKAVKALVYRQGESEAYGEGRDWAGYFDIFYRNLKIDLPSIRQLYVFQIDIIDSGIAAAPLVRDAQRALIGKYADIQVIPSMGTPGFDGLHYSDEGYAQNAFELSRLVGRDFYGSTDVDNIDAPTIRRAYYPSKDRNEIVLVFTEGQALTWTGQFEGRQLNDFIYLDRREGEIKEGRAAGNQLILTLKNPSRATKLTYLPIVTPDFLYRGPYITNKRGMRALSFYDFPIDPPPLDPPLVRVDVVSESSLQISWEPVTDATSYIVEVQDPQQGTYKRLNQVAVPTLTYLAGELSPATTYTFRVKALGDRTESPFASESGTTPKLLVTPAVSLTVIYNNALTLGWSAVPNATAYQIERRGPGAEFQKIGVIKLPALTLSDTDLTPGTAYTYQVKALGDKTVSPTVSISAVTPDLLSTPMLLAAAISFDTTRLAWQAVPNATHYVLERKKPSASLYENPLRLEGTDTQHIDRQLQYGATYQYRLTAYGAKTQSKAALLDVTTLRPLAVEPAVTLTLWPNPVTSGQVMLRLSAPVTGQLRVTDLRGVVYQQQQLTNATQLPLALVNYPAAVYLIRIERGNDVLVQKLLVN